MSKNHSKNISHSGNWDNTSYGSYEQPKRCFHSHPPLKIGDFTIYGGSCCTPAVTDADIYIGFDHGMQRTPVAWPWNEQTKPAAQEVFFPIIDMSVPKDLDQFNKMLDWIVVQLIAQKKIHMGCIGGHGRTGLVLAALVKKVMGIEDAVTYVRENYCQKVVESDAQIEFLYKHYGIKKVHGSKMNPNWSAGGSGSVKIGNGVTSARSSSRTATPSNTPKSSKAGTNNVGTDTREHNDGGITAYPARHPMSIWGQHFRKV